MNRSIFNFQVRLFFSVLLSVNLIFLSEKPLWANPTGGAVTSGSATISGRNGLTTIRQTSNAAIINWQTFSINQGETTQFIQPGSQSATLNRVLGGSTSQINGYLKANGQIYLINGNGIIVGPGGVISTAGFVGSTRDIADGDFQKKNLHFVGNGSGSVVNQGIIHSTLGDVVLIGKTVDNQGTIQARGTAGLVAGDDVLLGQQNADGSTITVNASPLATKASSQIGVRNSGNILATAAELKAANGNIYAIAIQNNGLIRASTVSHQGGRIYLTADSGTLVNSGTLNASATQSGGHGGSVSLRNMGGTTIDSGKILARGGQGGAGGNAEVSGEVVDYLGTVDLTAPGGTTGNLLFDPENVTIQTTGPTTATSSGTPVNTYTANVQDSIITIANLEAALALANVTVSTGTTVGQAGDITVANALTWSQNTTLTLSAANNIFLNADITAPAGRLNLIAGSKIRSGNETTNGTITANLNLSSFILQNGAWLQNSATLPTFIASNKFEALGSFLRVTGGNGTTTAYGITDIYGLQGIGSYLSSNFVLDNDINAAGTSTWTNPDGNGFIPIGDYSGTFNGAGYVILGLTINSYSENYKGLFGYTASSSVLENIGILGGYIRGVDFVGGLVGFNGGMIEACYASDYVSGISDTGGLVGYNNGVIETSNASGGVNFTGYGNGLNVGGLVGTNAGLIEASHANGSSVSLDEICNDVGGLVGDNKGTIMTSYATGSLIGTENVGGLVGFNDSGALIKSSYASGFIDGFQSNAGGLVGENNGIVETSYATGNAQGVQVGGLVGQNNHIVENSYATGKVSGYGDLGGLVGLGAGGTVGTCYSTGNVAGSGTRGGLVGVGGTVEASYWAQDTGLNMGLSGIGSTSSNSGATPETLANMMLQSTFTPAGTGAPNWDFTSTWIATNYSAPLLQALSVNLSGNTVYSVSNPLNLISNGQLLQTTAVVNGKYGFFVPDNVLTSGALITTNDGFDSIFYIAGQIPSGPITGVNFIGGGLSVQGTGVADNGKLQVAIGSLTGDGINYSVDVSTLTVNGTVGELVDVSTPYFLDGDINATDIVILAPSSGTYPVTLVGDYSNNSNGKTIQLGTLTETATVTFSPGTTNQVVAGNVDVSGFILETGSWSQNNTLSSFTAYNDFELGAGTSFLRSAGGSGTATNPYQIVDIYGLQGIGSPSNAYLSSSFVLDNNLDATGTATWNGSAGFAPIGTLYSNNGYAGTFNGAGYTISGLSINRPSQDYIGLFGATGALSVIKNVGLTGESISGLSFIGGLAGYVNNGTITGDYTTGTVSGNVEAIGGLVGSASGTLSNCYSTATVTGADASFFLGGLVGQASGGTVSNTYATGNVSGGTNSYNIGGLVGENSILVQNTYATGSVTGGTGSYDIGGLVGTNITGLVQTSYSAGNVTGGTNVGGLVGAGNTDTVEASYWAQDTGLNAGLFGIGYTESSSGSNAQATPETLANLQVQSTFAPAGTAAGQWSFALGTGVWGINGYTSTGLINNGMPYFQWQYPTQAQIVPVSQTLTYSGTTGTPNTTTYSVNYAPGYSSLNALLNSGPILSMQGSNVNVVNAGPVNIVSANLSVKPGYTVEVARATVTYAPYALTVTPTSGQTVQYGASKAGFTYSVSSPLNSDVVTESGALGGYIQYIDSVVNEPTSPISLGSLISNNSNYSLSLATSPVYYTVTSKPVVVIAKPFTTTYGSAPDFGYTIGGLPSDIGGPATFTTNDSLSKAGYLDSGTYTYKPIIDNPNLTVTTVAAEFTVKPADLLYVADPVLFFSGNPVPTFGGSVTGFVSGDNVYTATSGSLMFGSNVSSSSPPGVYGIYGFGLTAQNYIFLQAPENGSALTVSGLDPYFVEFENGYKPPFFASLIQADLTTTNTDEPYYIFDQDNPWCVKSQRGGSDTRFGDGKENPGKVIAFGSSYTEAHKEK